MKFHKPARFTLTAVAVLAIPLIAAATGCNAADSACPNLRADLVAIRSAHRDPDAIGSLDATAPPINLDRYRHGNGRNYRILNVTDRDGGNRAEQKIQH
jgi:hypothetical protein